MRCHVDVNPGHNRHASRLLLVCGDVPLVYEFSDVLVVGDDEALKAQFAAQDVRQQIAVDVTGNAVDLCRVDHYGVRTRTNGRREGWQKVLAQIVFGNPSRLPTPPRHWEAVPTVT